MSRDAQGHTVDDHGGADCSETLHRLYEFLDGEMTPEDTVKIQAHLLECGPCMAEHDRETAMKALLRRACACEPAPVELRMRIVQRITTIRLEG
mgnify:CR=1 FL=1